ncbi:MAG: ion channel [Ferruginibacter sp.]
MAFLKKINTKAQTSASTGFGDNASNYGGRFLRKDGQANIKKTGIGFLERYSWFHSMLAMKRWKFFIIVLSFYIIVNVLFAIVYYLLGPAHLSGMIYSSELERFGESFFFSTQTFTTVGYGRISPLDFYSSAIAAFQALVGLLSFALATGLMYGRFSRPTAYIKFSENALIAPYKGITGLMIRLAPFKNATLTDAESKLTLGMMIEENGKLVNRFFPLELELEKVNALNLSWTLVHPITESSPVYGFSKEDFQNIPGELIVFLKAFDDKFSNTVVARSSYTFNEIIYGAAYNPMFYRDERHKMTVLDLDKLNDFKTINLPSIPVAVDTSK